MIVAEGITLPGRLERTALTIEGGQRVAVVGPNGGGKTSLLRALAGVEGAAGIVTVDGKALPSASPAQRLAMTGFLAASRDLQWPIAVRDLVSLGLVRPDADRIAALLEMFELVQLADRPSNALSTGERARVLMARALASRPALLLLDEPLSNLDPYWVLHFLDIIDNEAARGAALLVSLHELAHLERFDRVLLVADGRLIQDTTPDALIASSTFEDVFRVVRRNGGYALKPPAGRRSSP